MTLFDWDEAKDRRNVEKHGIGFAQAQRIFDGPTLDQVDDRVDYGETRIVSLGLLADIVVLSVTHTDRNGRIRLISARRASRQERTIYHGALRPTAQP